MAAIYRDGNKLVVDVTTAKIKLDAGQFVQSETADGQYLRLTVDGEQILHAKYTLITDENGSAYTKAQVLALLDEFTLTELGSQGYPSGLPARVTATLTRPADTANYTAGDAINAYTAAVKQKETMTISGAVAVKQKQTVTLSGSAPVKQKQTITLAGTEGTATIGYSWISFGAEFDTDLATTASNFVTENATSFLGLGIVLTSDSADLILEAETAGTPFDEMTITNDTGDLDGTSESTTANVVIGKVNIGIWNVLTFDQSFDTSVNDTAAAYVTAHATAWDAKGIVITNSGADIIFEAKVTGTPFNEVLAETITGDLAGAVVATTANVPLATGIISGAGGLSLPISYVTSAAATALAFKAANEAAYLAQGIVLTNSGADIIFEAATAGVPFTVPALTQLTGTIADSVAHTTANASLLPLTLSDVAINNGGGGFIMDFKMETSAVQFASATIRVWLFNDTPAGIVGDNVAYVNSFANADKRMACAYFDCTFDALLAGSDTVIGKCQPNAEYVCATASKNMYALIQTTSAITSPASAGVFKFYFNILKVN